MLWVYQARREKQEKRIRQRPQFAGRCPRGTIFQRCANRPSASASHSSPCESAATAADRSPLLLEHEQDGGAVPAQGLELQDHVALLDLFLDRLPSPILAVVEGGGHFAV